MRIPLLNPYSNRYLKRRTYVPEHTPQHIRPITIPDSILNYFIMRFSVWFSGRSTRYCIILFGFLRHADELGNNLWFSLPSEVSHRTDPSHDTYSIEYHAAR